MCAEHRTGEITALQHYYLLLSVGQRAYQEILQILGIKGKLRYFGTQLLQFLYIYQDSKWVSLWIQGWFCTCRGRRSVYLFDRIKGDTLKLPFVVLLLVVQKGSHAKQPWQQWETEGEQDMGSEKEWRPRFGWIETFQHCVFILYTITAYINPSYSFPYKTDDC